MLTAARWALLLVPPRLPSLTRLPLHPTMSADAGKAAWLAKLDAPLLQQTPPPPPEVVPPLDTDPSDRSQFHFQTAPLVSELPEGPALHLTPHDIVISCMVALQENDSAEHVVSKGVEWGRRFNWKFFGGMVRANWHGDIDTFVREAVNNPTGLANCEWFNTEEDTIKMLPGTQTRGATCKMIVSVRPFAFAPVEQPATPDTGRLINPARPRGPALDVVPQPAKERKFLWTLQRERRPPQEGCWLISSVLAVDRALYETT